MTKDAFDKIKAGLGEAKAYLDGSSSKRGYGIHVPARVNVKKIRTRLGLSQESFAQTYGFALSAVRELQPLATVLPTSRADTPIGALLRRGEGPAAWPAVQVEGQEGSAHTPGVQTVVLRHPGPVDLHRLKMLLQLICSRPGWEILRIKGIFRCTDQDRPVVAHGIHQWLELGPGPGNPPLESALMVVGRGLDPDVIGRGWRAALA